MTERDILVYFNSFMQETPDVSSDFGDWLDNKGLDEDAVFDALDTIETL